MKALFILTLLAGCELIAAPDGGAFQKQECQPVTIYFDDDEEQGFDHGASIESHGYEQGALIPDTFDDEVAAIKRGRAGMPQITPLNSSWIHLTRGKTIGGQVVLPVLSGGLAVSNNILEVVGPSDAAMQLCITLTPPKRIYNTAAALAAGQRATGEEIINPQPVPAHANDGSTVDIFATIEWGIGGTSCSAVIDYQHGTQINIHASWVRITANAIAIGGANEVIKVGAFIGPGMAKPDAAQRTQYPMSATFPNVYVATLAAGTITEPIPVPNFAREWRFVADVGFGIVGTPPNVIIYHLQTANPLLLSSQVEQINSFDLMTKWYTVPTSTHFLQIENLPAGPPLAFPAIVFKLSI